jgi:hypothetical protein
MRGIASTPRRVERAPACGDFSRSSLYLYSRSAGGSWCRCVPEGDESAPSSKYVYVDDDGSARELDTQEREYLTAEFPGGDGGRPYVKLRYESLTPDGRIRGYLRRRQLPKRVAIKSRIA